VTGRPSATARPRALHRRPQARPLVDRTHRELTDADIARIADTYHAWRRAGAKCREGQGWPRAAAASL